MVGSLKKIAVLGSGAGSNFDAIADASDRGVLGAQIAVVISDNANARILEKARDRGIPAVFVDPGPRPHRFPESAQRRLLRELRAAGVDLVVLAGFMRVIKEPLLSAYPDRIVNIHPSLLPRHPGLKAWEQALAAGDKEAGCTVHLVNAEIDAGKILGQARVPVLEDDTPETLLERIHGVEHRLYPEVIARMP